MTENGKPQILVADDQPDILEALRLLLKSNGFDVQTANSPAAALAALERRDFDAMLLDMNYARDTTSGKEGLELLTSLQSH
jgi:CheY-like chemotaxis protein